MEIAKKLDAFGSTISTRTYLIVLTVSLAAFIYTNVHLGNLFDETGYPVPLLVSQTRFSAETLKSDFAVLLLSPG